MRVNPGDRQADITGEQPPRIAIVPTRGATPAIVIVWTAKLAEGTAVLMARSDDGGRSFGHSVPVAGSVAPGNRGWESIAADASGRLYVAWLDHRDTAAASTGAHAMHQHGVSPTAATVDGTERAQRSQLFIGTVQGTDPARGVARGVCYCCKTALLAGPDGAVYAAWRHVHEGNHRDIAFTVSRDGGRSFAEPVRVSEDGWQIDGCPENGPALGADNGGRIHVVWPTVVTGRGGEALKLFTAFTSDGKTFSARVPLPTSGAAYHPQLAAAPDGTMFAAWDELRSGTPRRIRVARANANASGSIEFVDVHLDDAAAGTYPAFAASTRSAVLAWTTREAGGDSMIAVRRIPY